MKRRQGRCYGAKGTGGQAEEGRDGTVCIYKKDQIWGAAGGVTSERWRIGEEGRKRE
jgi:hypothetical protein